MHSLETYNGANRRTTLPKRRRVNCLERLESSVKKPEAAGEIRAAKSFNDNLLFTRLLRTSAGLAARERLTNCSGDNELNSATKLTRAM
jgi:hypothetical protein